MNLEFYFEFYEEGLPKSRIFKIKFKNYINIDSLEYSLKILRRTL